MPPLPLRPQMPAPAIWLVAAVAATQAWVLWPQRTSIGTLLSIAGIVALAFAIYRLLGALDVRGRAQWATVVLVLPSVAFDALAMGRWDALQAAACVMAVTMAIEQRHLAMFAWCGVAAAFGAQAVQVAPFVIALAVRHRTPLRYWLAAPAALLAMMAPALLAGSAPADLASAYFRLDGGVGGEIARDAPNIWSLANVIAPGHAPALFALALAAALGTAAAFAAQMQRARFGKAGLVGMAALSTQLAAGLLPGMEASDFLLAGVLTLAYAIARGTRQALASAALVQLGSFAAILSYLGLGMPMLAIGALCMIAAAWIAAQPLIAPHANDNRDGSHAIPPPHGLRGTLSFDMLSAAVAPARSARPRGSKLDVR